MKALVIFDSVYGNTEKIARAIGTALGTPGEVRVIQVTNAAPADLQGLDRFFIGSPTRGFKPTEAIVGFLDQLPDGALKGVKAAAFDTRIPLESIKSPIFRFIVGRGGYADKPIAAELVRLGAEQPVPSAGFIVLDREGPLKEGELERAALWVKNIF